MSEERTYFPLTWNEGFKKVFKKESIVYRIRIDALEKAINALEKAIPVKTYKDDFFEKFPKADRDESNYPCDCVNNLYGTDIVCVGENSCKDCWNRVYKEEYINGND